MVASLAATVCAPKTEPKRADSLWNPAGIKYSICTLVTHPQQYEEMRQSFLERGFNSSDVEFIYLDNSKGNTFDAYSGCNLFLTVARGDYIVICHQDVLLEEQGRPELDVRLSELEVLDPNWAVCGNSGGVSVGKLATRISDPHGENTNKGPFPARVQSLDENFIVAKRRANLSVSGDLAGFHMYGADICVIADVLGHTSYVIDFHLRHKGSGLVDESFWALRTAFFSKYARTFRSRSLTTTCTTVFLSGTPFVGRVLSTLLVARFVRRLIATLGRSGAR